MNKQVTYKTPQEDFWAGSFGDEYIERNRADRRLPSNIAMFAKIFGRCDVIRSVIEFGANIGLNLEAIRMLLPNAKLEAVEINQRACEQLSARLPDVNVHDQSILEFQPDHPFDLALVKGVLIHMNPSELERVYAKLAAVAARYVVIAEYYNPVPTSIDYRGHQERLFKRDFAGEFLDHQDGFTVIDYGFLWRRDPNFPQDDITWFLLERLN